MKVTTDLPAILATAERSLLVSRTGVVLLSVQLVVLAVYAVLLSASLLIEHRQGRQRDAPLAWRGDEADRRAGAHRGLLLTVPAALLAPWLAVAALGAFNVVGPLAEIGLCIDPSVTADAYVAAAVAAGICLVALTLPGLLASRSHAVPVKSGRAETTGIGRRLGIDIALLASPAIGPVAAPPLRRAADASVQGTSGSIRC